jgi:hypothetical protein
MTSKKSFATVKLYFLLYLTVFCIAPAMGQVNTEKLRRGLDEDGFAGGVEAVYSITQGNSDLMVFGLMPGFVWRIGGSQIFMINELETASADGGDLINRGFSHLRFNYELHPSWVYELFLQAQYDKSQDLAARYLAGSGLRMRIIRKELTQLSVGVGAMFEYEEVDSGEITRIARGSNYISFRTEKPDRSAISSTVYIQPKFSDANDIRILGEAALELMISNNLAFTNTLVYRYDSEPTEDIKEYDLKIKGGLKVIF